MGKVHEALERAEKEYQKNQPSYFYKPQKPILTGSKIQGDIFTVSKPFDDLKANLLNRYPESNVKSILFNGICHGTGCTTAALNFANSLTIGSKRKVLLVDLNSSLPQLRRIHQPAETSDLPEHTAVGKQLKSKIENVGPGNLYLVSCGARTLCGPVGLYEDSEFERFINSIYNYYDYLILDAPPVLVYSEFRILCSKIDGVVLVIDAGKNRRQIALKTKKEIEEAGGNILGVVINRRKYYIPEWIYKRL